MTALEYWSWFSSRLKPFLLQTHHLPFKLCNTTTRRANSLYTYSILLFGDLLQTPGCRHNIMNIRLQFEKGWGAELGWDYQVGLISLIRARGMAVLVQRLNPRAHQRNQTTNSTQILLVGSDVAKSKFRVINLDWSCSSVMVLVPIQWQILENLAICYSGSLTFELLCSSSWCVTVHASCRVIWDLSYQILDISNYHNYHW